MIRRKKEIKRLFFTALIIATICISNVQILNNFIVLDNENLNNKYIENVLDEVLLSSNRNLDDNITGSGVDQDIRIYANNQSKNLQNNEVYFEIPSVPTEDMFLTYGNFNFTFQNNFTTSHIIENDDALYADDFIAFDFNTGYSGITFKNGTRIGGFSLLTDGSNGTHITGISTPSGLLNFTIVANFTDAEYTSSVIKGNVKFNRSKILALISSLVLSIENDKDVNITVRIKNFSDSTWEELISTQLFNGSLGRQKLKERFINENLKLIDLDNLCEIEFVLERGDSFTAYLYEYDLKTTYSFELPITNQSYVALEFDLRGKKSAVHGFYAWVRSLDFAEAVNTQLNITLYRANRTVVRTDANLRNIKLDPDYNEMIDSVVVNAYTGDSLSYFEFNNSNTGKLKLSNYFIVIKSNNSKEVYSLVTLPHFDYGDTITEHQLKTTIDDGNTWINAKKDVETDYRTYTSGQLDASSFMLNVTRGYMPSDFIINDNYTLRIQNLPLVILENNTSPYNESSFLTWGLGQWEYNLSTPIEDDPLNNFRVELTWNKTFIKGFKFNISDYSVNAYWVEDAKTTYNVKYDADPEWLYTYDFNITSPLFNDWDFIEFWFIFPDFLIAHNVTNPNSEKILPYNAQQTTFSDNPSKDKIIIPSNLATLSGLYILNLTSYNFISAMNSYINYNGLLWESSGFMYGDNISISTNIQDPNSNPPSSGNITVTLFYPNGTQFRELNSSIGLIQNSGLFYNFDNQTILDLTNDLTIFGKYHLGFFWFNGSAIGCKKLTVFIDTYNVVLNNCEYYPQKGTNVLDGEIINKVFQNYTVLIASVNETTGISMPNYYPINNSNIYSLFSYEVGGQELPILLTSFRQSENILNPGETVNINVALQNLHPFIPVDVKVDVKLVSYINEDWVITENTSDPALLDFSGHPNESYEFSVDLRIPDLDASNNIWGGTNGPIRLGGVKTIITIYIDDFVIGEFKSTESSLLSNETSDNFDGYILGLRIAEEATSRSILYDFERDECLYFPKNSTFLVNIIDQNYISSYDQFIGDFSLRLNSQFTNISINPNNPIKGLSFNLSSILTTEFGEELSGKNITCQYFDNNDNWNNIVSDITNSNGFTEFLIKTQIIDFEDDLLLRLIWDGDSINGVSKNISVNVIHESDNISISIISLDVLIYQGKDTHFKVFLTNMGNSNLRVIDISIEVNHDFYNSIVEIDYLVLEQFSPGESTNFIVEMQIGYIGNFELSISITAQNIITNKSIIVLKEASFKTYDPPIYDYLIEFFFIIILGIIALVWIMTFFYARKIKRQIETPIEEPIRRKPRKQRYVPVSELKKPTPIKKPLKKKEAPKEAEEEKVDLDSLLEERGLVDKKKKPKE